MAAYPVLPYVTDSNCTILADCRGLVSFLISGELWCQSWEMPLPLEHTNMTKEETLHLFIFWIICYLV